MDSYVQVWYTLYTCPVMGETLYPCVYGGCCMACCETGSCFFCDPPFMDGLHRTDVPPDRAEVSHG